MKAIIINLIILIITLPVCNAQFSDDIKKNTKEKKFFIGGSFSFNKSKNDNTIISINGTNEDTENTSYSIFPDIGYQLNDHWILGFELGINQSSSEVVNNSDVEFSSSSLNYSLFSRYLINPNNSLQFFLSPYISYDKFNSETRFTSFDNISNFERTSNSLGVSLGIQYTLIDRLRLTSNLGGFNFTRGKSQSNDEPEIDYQSMGFNFRGSTLYFGFEFLF